MPPPVICSSCGAKLRAPTSANAVGRILKCPKCGSQISAASVTIALLENPRSSHVRESSGESPIKRRADAGEEAVAASKLPLGFGITSLALSIIGIVCHLSPGVDAITMPLSALGLLLGIIGTAFAWFCQERGIGFPLAGSLAGLVGLGLAIM